MKRCPKCNRVETDDSLSFCRADGTSLITGSLQPTDDAVTAKMRAAASETETNILPQTDQARPTPATTVLSPGSTQVKKSGVISGSGKLRWAIIAGVGLIVVISAAAYFSSHRRTNATIQSIAVMPFVNDTGNANVEYLSDGITESLIRSLSEIPNLNVKARSSVFRYKGKDARADTLARELNVQAVLNGRVVNRDKQFVLSLELIDAKTENVIWSGEYTRTQADVLSMQSEIARDVSRKLQTRLSGSTETRLAATYSTNPEAYERYLKARFHWNKRTPQDLQKSVDYFQQAIALDPQYALAYAGLADGYTLLAAFGGAPPREVMPKAKDAALKCISLDEHLSEPYVALGHIAEYYDYDFAQSEQHFLRAIQLNPNNANAHEFLGTLLSNLGRHQEAKARIKRALELEPTSVGANRMYGEALLFARKYDESIAQLKKTIDLDSGFSSAYRSLARVYLVTQNYPEHVEAHARHFELIGETETAALMRDSFKKGGWQGYLRAMTGPNRPTRFFFPAYLAVYFAQLGENDKAFEELNKTYEDRFYYIAWMKNDPCLDRLRSDPRFDEMLKRIRL